MKTFRCDHCRQPVYFENPRCLHCGHTLAFLPDQFRVAALDRGEDGLWRIARPRNARAASSPSGGTAYRLCSHYLSTDTCNWAVEASDPNPLCVSCRLTTVIPDLSLPGRQQAFYKMEAAKRRLLFNLRELGLPVFPHETTHPLSFSFLESPPEGPAVVTGHAEGRITIDLAEADDVARVRSRAQFNEAYRTVLGHLRHEIGHFYWDELVAPQEARLAAFRELFGDERQDYAQALQRHYEQPAADWSARHISCYASAHPWEDWAETWAHYLHLRAVMETADDFAASVRPITPALEAEPVDTALMANSPRLDFQALLTRWIALSIALNALNRSMGLDDLYPFTLAEPVRRKLCFVHETVCGAAVLA